MMLRNSGGLIVATAPIGGGQLGGQEDAALEFFNSDLVLRWTEVALGRQRGRLAPTSVDGRTIASRAENLARARETRSRPNVVATSVAL